MLASPPELTCIYFPNKTRYETADEASCALREVAVAYMKGNVYDQSLTVYQCRAGHWHLGRNRRDQASA